MDSIEQTTSAGDALLKAAREELAEKGHASVSLRAVARRAGVSHAAPAHFFGDRAGMLTAVAVDGYRLLTQAMAAAAGAAAEAGEPQLAALGRAYVDFGLAEPALADLMFRTSELSPEDPTFVAAQREAFGRLHETVAETTVADAQGWSLISWAVVHGLVSLTREGVLAPVAGQDQAGAPALARELVELYASSLEGFSARD